MKLFMWMQNKLARSNHRKKPTPNIPPPIYDEPGLQHSEDFGDWSRCLLTIGTLGSDGDRIQPQNASVSRRGELLGGESEDEGNLARDSDLLSLKSEFLEDVEKNKVVVIPERRKDLHLERNAANSVRKTPSSLLLKQMFVCGGGFTRLSILRSSMPESRVDKMLRAMFRKKIHPRASAQALHAGRFLDHRQCPPTFSSSSQQIHKDPDEAAGIKWDRSDPEYIVLDI